MSGLDPRVDEIDSARVLAAQREAHARDGDNPMVVRPMRASDIPFVSNSWILNYQKGQMVKRIRDRVYKDAWHAVLEHLLPRCPPLVACHPQSPDTCFGWICGEEVQGGPNGPGTTLMLHYAYVKHGFKAKLTRREDGKKSEFDRGFGVGRMLLKALMDGREYDNVVATCITPQGHGWLSRMYEEEILPVRYEYDPFLLFTTLPKGWY